MPEKKSKITGVPSKDVGKVVQGFVLVKATKITCTKTAENSWTVEAMLPDEAAHSD